MCYKGQMNPRHNNQIDRAISILDKSPVVAIFSQDRDALFHFRKTERIVAALYLITSILSDSEPIKYEIRGLGTELIREVLSFRILVQDEKKTREISTRVARLLSLLDLAHISDLLPLAHLTSLKRELVVFIEAIEKRGSSGLVALQSSVIPESFFDSPLPANAHKGQSMSFKDVLNDRKEIQKKSVFYDDLNTTSHKGHFSRSRAIQDGRKVRITALLREKGNVSIRDISEVIRDCSTKSIQRLLSELVKGGVLKTEGEKRWTRYILKGEQKV